ncbi:alpha-xylosidase [Balneolaceae bacterium ANBcel3]|nr:alpha-xylosidase [Balneolaceae bacterium ANBcel3]
MNTILQKTYFFVITSAITMLVFFTFKTDGKGQSMPRILNETIDITDDFYNYVNNYFLADSLVSFDPVSGSGEVKWIRHHYGTAKAFNNMLTVLRRNEGNEFPAGEYAVHPSYPFHIEFVSPRTVRMRMTTGPQVVSTATEESLMLVNGYAPSDDSWEYVALDGAHRYQNEYGSVTIHVHPWKVEFHDADGRLLTSTNHQVDNETTLHPVLPFSFVRRAHDYTRSVAAVFNLEPGERMYGGGESFTRLNKRGQKVKLWVNDSHGSQNQDMHKPVPFLMSNRGYGMFVHSTTPMTFDIGDTYHSTNAMMIADDELDLFIFMGSPKEILDEYTELTGKSPMPPLWSFGLWMSRITYFSEEEVRDVAENLRKHRIPSDVIHLDTGWFETDWRNDFIFAESRFDDPEKMISDLNDQGFKTSIWQLPYFVPQNLLYPEVVERGLHIKDGKGNVPFEDAILDFTNPEAIEWYSDKIADLLNMGVGAIKVDFGEAAPFWGVYHNGRTGLYEHNLYPLRYNKIVGDLTYEISGEHIIWARSTWAGSQRYPVHWGGDAGNSSSAMEASLRGGLSIGLSGFSFWSHDIGGFPVETPEELYRRWTPFGMLSSHSRSHGHAPKEPWLFSDEFLDLYRQATEMRYKLMPYIYAQAKESSEKGLPMVRALFVEYPEDPGSWLVEDQYLFGSDILVAPLMQDHATSRNVYLPPGKWIDYQTGMVYAGGWHHIESGSLPVVMLVRDGAVIPHIELAQHTREMDWSEVDLVVFSAEATHASGKLCLPEEGVLHTLEVEKDENGQFSLTSDPLNGGVRWTVMPVAIHE